MLDRFRLDDTTAIVTGGSRNMGRVFSLALADAGANVAIVDLPQQADAAGRCGAGSRNPRPTRGFCTP